MSNLKIDSSKRYNQVTWAMAHDSHTATKNYSDHDLVPISVDQTLMPSEQLAGGIRAVRISTGTPILNMEWWGNIIVQHTVAFGLFRDYLSQVVAFLNDPNNRNEIVTIIDEGDNSIGWSSEEYFNALAAEYAECLGGQANQPGAGTGGVSVYVPGNDRTQWPTVQEMINNNTRLVVFMQKAQNDTAYNWMLPAYDQGDNGLIAMNIYTAFGSNPEAYLDPSGFKSERWPSTGNPNLYLFNHYFYEALTPKISQSFRGYNQLTVGFKLVRDVFMAWNTLQIRPNFINVDFFQGVWGVNSFLIPLVNAMNARDNAQDAVQQVQGMMVPSGPYQANCKDLQVTLYCMAEQFDRTYNSNAYLDLTYMTPLSTVSNNGGNLESDPGNFSPENFFDSYIPVGDYKETCKEIRVVLSGSAQKDDQSWVPFSLDITNYTIGYLVNQNGTVNIIPPTLPPPLPPTN